MSEKSGIEWTDHTFNPWWGCMKVSPGCDHCYYEKTCEHCKATVKMAHVIDQQHGGWRWGAFDPKPLTAPQGYLLFRRHRCGYQYQQRPQGARGQRGLF